MSASARSIDLDGLDVPGPQGLAALRDDPPRAGRLATAARRATTGEQVWIYDLRTTETPDHAEQSWPSPADAAARSLEPGSLAVCVSPERASEYAAWVGALVEALAPADQRHPDFALAPYSAAPAGTHRLWLIAAARLRLPAPVRVMARHDLVGLRIAQLALAFGADALGGPITPDRKLPLAGVTRPNENTRAGLHALVEQAGLSPIDRETP